MLSGRTVLIVEAQYLIALDLQNTLEDFGAPSVVIARNATHALQLALTNCHLAIVEVECDLPEQISLVGELLRRGIHVIGLTADAELHQKLKWFSGTPILVKPVPTDRVLDAIGKLLKSQKE